MIAGTLEVQILANLARLQEDMNKAKGVVTSAVSSIQDAAGKAKQALGLLGAALAVGSVTGFVGDVIKAAAALDDMSEMTGASVANLSRLQSVAKIGGKDFSIVEGSLVKLVKGLKGVEEESKGASGAMEFLGIKARDSVTKALRDPAELVQEIAVELAKYEEGAGKTSIALDLFGKSGAAMLPILKDMVEMGGGVAKITAEQAAQAEQLEKNFRRLQASGDAWKKTMAMDLVPWLGSVADAMVRARKEGGSLAAVIAGIRTAFTGTDQYKSDVELTELVSRQLEVERLLAQEKDPQRLFKRPVMIASLEREQKEITERLRTVQAFRAQLQREEDAAKPEPRKPLAYTSSSGKKETDKAAEEYKRLINRIEELNAAQEAELTGYDKLSEAQKAYAKILRELRDNEKGLTDAQKAQIAIAADRMLKTDAELRQRKEEIEAAKQLVDGLKAIEEQQRKMDEVVARANTANSQRLQEIEFETRMEERQVEAARAVLLPAEDRLRLEARLRAEREIANEQRRIELQLEQDLLALGPEVSDDYNERADTLRNLANAQKEAVGAAIQGREDARLANDIIRNRGEEYVAMWQRVEGFGKQAFTSLFAHGSDKMEALGESIKVSILDLLYELTVRKWIISIGAEFSSSFVGGAAGAAGRAAVGGFNPTNLFGGGGQLFADVGNFFGNIGTVTEMGEVFGVMDAIGGFAAANPLAVGGLALGAMLLGGDLFGGGGGPKASDIGILGGPGAASFTQNNVTDSPWGEAYAASFAQRYANLRPEGRAIFDPYIGASWMASGPDSAQNLVSQYIEPIFQAAERASQEAQKAADDFAERLRDVRRSLDEARDPLGYWTREVDRLGGLLGTGVTTESQWQSRLNLEFASPSQPMTAARLENWVALGEATRNLDRIRAEERERVEALAAQRREMEIRLLDAQGRSVEAVAARRHDELAALDASLRGIQEQIYAAEDLAAAQAEAAQAAAQAAERQRVIAGQRSQMQVKVYELEGNATAALALQRELELAAIDESLRPLQQYIYQLQDQQAAAASAAAAQEQAAAAQRAAADAARDLANQVKAVQSSLSSAETGLGQFAGQLDEKLGIRSLESAISAMAVSPFLSPEERLAAALGQRDALFAAGRSGNLDAISGFEQALQSTLSLGRDVYASGSGFQAIFVEGNRQLNELLAQQKQIQSDLVASLPVAVIESGQNTVAALRQGFAEMVSEVQGLRAELRRLTATG